MPKGIYNHYKIKGRKKPDFTDKLLGKNNINYVDGRYSQDYFCIDCGKEISKFSGIYGQGRCQSCEMLRRNYKSKNNPNFGKLAKHSKWVKYKNIFMRSNWEVLYAKYLDKNKIKWQYESKVFNLGDSTYRPDFYLSEINNYIEIKGYWRDDAKKKFNLFKKLYPKINIKVLKQKDLQSMGVL